MAPKENSIIVRLLIFSGRPDPEWPLYEEEIGPLGKYVAVSMEANLLKEAPPGGLGYRGFFVQNPSKLADIPAEFRVYHGVLTIARDEHVEHREDAGNIEAFLLENARNQGWGDLISGDGLKSAD